MLFYSILAAFGWLCTVLLFTLICFVSFEDYTSKLHKTIRAMSWAIMIGGATLLWLFLWYGNANPFCSVGGFLILLGL
jgi:hypothetical protein